MHLKVTAYMGDGWRFDFRKTHFDRCSPPDFYARVSVSDQVLLLCRTEIEL
jgi:phosphatidylinositol phospholipase C, delta